MSSSTSFADQIGLNAGIGIRFRVSPVDLVVEARYHRLFSAGEDARVIPITLGILF